MRNVAVAILTLFGTAAAQEGGGRVVAYVSMDREHSERLLQDFEKETGIVVDAFYDTEANKTVGIVNRLVAEKGAPQCDVYWNNELATTVKLKLLGVLEPYRSPQAASIPAGFKDPDHTWTGFGARARVLIVNTDLVSEDEMPTSMWDLADPKWRGKTCMARPETGTTAMHAAALYVALGQEEADRYFRALVDNDVQWRQSNGQTMRDVRDGLYAFGWTDTDDFHVARLQDAPVAQVFPDAGPDDVGVLYVPNAVMLIRGGPNPEAGKVLIDWLLGPEVEARLAASASAQIPVRPGVPTPEHVRRPDEIGKQMNVDFDAVGREYDRWVEHVRVLRVEAEKSTPTLLWIVVGVVAVALIAGGLLKRATAEPQ